MVRPERRTRGDLIAVVVITVSALLGSSVLWWYSDARATVSRPAAHPAPPLPTATSIPDELRRLWAAPSAATPEPVVAGPTVVTARGGDVLGRDPVTGEVRWRYSREIPLCTVGAEWGRAIAVYRKSDNCSEVTSLQGDTGKRGPQRNSDVGFGTRLLSDGTYVTATGRQLFATWRSDLVRTQQYGIPTAIKIPDNNLPRPECEYASIAVGDQRVAVIEECPHAPGDRITVLNALPEDSEQPEEIMSTLVGGSHASVVAVTEQRVAVLLRERDRLAVYDLSASLRGLYPVQATDSPTVEANVRVEPTTIAEQRVYWYTGNGTVALEGRTLTPLWTIPDTLGSAVPFAGELLVPVPGGIAVHEPATGKRLRVLPVDRGDYRGPVKLATAGRVILEQRGDTLVALR